MWQIGLSDPTAAFKCSLIIIIKMTMTMMTMTMLILMMVMDRIIMSDLPKGCCTILMQFVDHKNDDDDDHDRDH